MRYPHSFSIDLPLLSFFIKNVENRIYFFVSQDLQNPVYVNWKTPFARKFTFPSPHDTKNISPSPHVLPILAFSKILQFQKISGILNFFKGFHQNSKIFKDFRDFTEFQWFQKSGIDLKEFYWISEGITKF